LTATRAGTRERERNGASDPAARSRDQHYLIGKTQLRVPASFLIESR
jgi:hypothetical protein